MTRAERAYEASRERRLLGWAVAGGLALACSALWQLNGCSLAELSPGDTERPSLTTHDVFSVTPQCLVIPVSSKSVIAPSRRLTVQARRASGTGAEAIPVRFRIGTCPSWRSVEDDAGTCPDGSMEAGIPRPDGAAAMLMDAGSPATFVSGYVPGCPSPTTNQVTWQHFALSVVDRARCHGSDVTSDVECVTAPDGTISVDVEGTGSSLNLDDPVPLCVSIRDADFMRTGWRDLHVVAQLVDDAARSTLAFEPPARGNTGCMQAPASDAGQPAVCAPVPLYEGRVGVVTGDVNASDGVEASDFKRVSGRLPVELRLSSRGDGHGYLIEGGKDCSRPDRDAAVSDPLPLDLQGISTPGFKLCGEPVASNYRIEATVVDRPDLSGGLSLNVDAAIAGIFPDAAKNRIEIQYCGEKSRPIAWEDLERVEVGGQYQSFQSGALQLYERTICDRLNQANSPAVGVTGAQVGGAGAGGSNAGSGGGAAGAGGVTAGASGTGPLGGATAGSSGEDGGGGSAGVTPVSMNVVPACSGTITLYFRTMGQSGGSVHCPFVIPGAP